LHEGHLWGERDVTVPVSEIDEIDTVRIELSKDKARTPPVIRVRHRKHTYHGLTQGRGSWLKEDLRCPFASLKDAPGSVWYHLDGSDSGQGHVVQ
jgi:hypothetical protein